MLRKFINKGEVYDYEKLEIDHQKRIEVHKKL